MFSKLKRFWVLTFVTILSFSLLVIPTSFAQSNNSVIFSHDQLQIVPNLKVLKNLNSSGYAIPKDSNLDAVTGTFTVPTVTCKSISNSLYFEIALFNTSNSNGATFGVEITCSAGNLYYYGMVFWENSSQGQEIVFSDVSPGNVIKGSITLASSGDNVTIKDVTTGNSFTLNFSGVRVNLAFWSIVPSSSPEIPRFSKVNFNGAEAAVDGKNLKPIGSFSNLVKEILYNPKTHHVLVMPSPLSLTGKSFSLVWKNSA